MSGVLSALVINDTICLTLTPVVLTAIAPLGLRPLLFLLAIALAANVGSAMAITGNPQNLLIGLASGMRFARFTAALAVPSLGGLAIVYLVLARLVRAELSRPLHRERERPEYAFDRTLVTKALVLSAGASAAWLAGYSLPGVAIGAGALMVATAGRDPAEAFAKVEWSLRLFFGALAVVVRGVAKLPLFASLTTAAAGQVHGDPWRDGAVVSGAMLALSNLVSNIAAVMLWLPVVPKLPRAEFVWLVMALSSTFAGNLTLLGSMANMIVAERAAARGIPLRSGDYLRAGVPVTILTTVWGLAVLVLLRG